MTLFQDRLPDVGIVYQRGILQFWLPSVMQKELSTRYNPRHVPAVVTNVFFLLKHQSVCIEERTQPDYSYTLYPC